VLTGAASLPPELQLRILDLAAASVRLPDAGAISQALPRTSADAFGWLMRLRQVCRAWRHHLGGTGGSAAGAALAARWRLERLRDVFWRSDFNAFLGRRKGASSWCKSVNGGKRFKLPPTLLLPMPELGGAAAAAADPTPSSGAGGAAPSSSGTGDAAPSSSGTAPSNSGSAALNSSAAPNGSASPLNTIGAAPGADGSPQGGAYPRLAVSICSRLSKWELQGLPGDALMLRVLAEEGSPQHVAAVVQLLRDVSWLDERALAWMIIKIEVPAGADAAASLRGPDQAQGPGLGLGTGGEALQPPGPQQAARQRHMALIRGAATHRLLAPYQAAFCDDPELGAGMNMEVGATKLYCCPVVTGFRRRQQ